MLDLNTVKEHCRVEMDFTDDDSLLDIYTGAAARYVETWTRRTLFDNEASQGYAEAEEPILLGDDVKAAMLLLIGHWYEHREAVVAGDTAVAVPFAVEALLQPYRIYGL